MPVRLRRDRVAQVFNSSGVGFFFCLNVTNMKLNKLKEHVIAIPIYLEKYHSTASRTARQSPLYLVIANSFIVKQSRFFFALSDCFACPFGALLAMTLRQVFVQTHDIEKAALSGKKILVILRSHSLKYLKTKVKHQQYPTLFLLSYYSYIVPIG
jgi:hypothetical protein